MNKATLILTTFLSIHASTLGQMNKDLFPLGREYRRAGFYINPELTYLLPIGTSSYSKTQDTLNYDFDVSGSGKLGYGIELGYFYSFKKPRLIHFIEGGIGYRKFSGKADHQGTLRIPSDTINFNSENKINVSLGQVSIRATHVKQLKRYSFISNSLGVNVNYLVNEKYERSNTYPSQFDTFVGKFSGQIHYQIGFGYRVSKHVVLIPSLETTLLQVYSFDEIRSGFDFFSHGYQPLIFKLRVLLLRKDPINCNAPRFDGPQPAL